MGLPPPDFESETRLLYHLALPNIPSAKPIGVTVFVTVTGSPLLQ